MSIHSFLELVEEKGGNEWQKRSQRRREMCKRKRLLKGRGRHGANFLYHIKCKREKKVLNKT